MMVDVSVEFCQDLHWELTSNDGRGHCFVVVNPKVFADGFEDRMQTLRDQYRNLEPDNIADRLGVAHLPTL
ncbi:hypothetical protein OS493_021595 [Desmophyllum pertusum]|uniref:Uncharacterized protein n=1 Tax=Desmophyllum pertusum TaxID=174260 RepID=A0A9W9YMM3_9CNID|nr:hypothetical protein OS493_021595 [Desmophyllum pertusum]